MDAAKLVSPLLCASARCAGRLTLETPRVWTRSRAENLRLIGSVHGEHRLDAAEAAGQRFSGRPPRGREPNPYKQDFR